MNQPPLTPQRSPGPLLEFDPLVPLRPGTRRKSIVVCIPGAGASVTSFIHLLDALPVEYAVYGLQPRGLDSDHTPDVSVEATAEFNIRALAAIVKGQSIQLLGHSYGGLIAFEMAQQCLRKELPIASLTIVDSTAPSTSRVKLPDVTDAEIRSEFIAAIEEDLGVHLGLGIQHITHGTSLAFVHALRNAMIGVGKMSARSQPDVLNGSFRTFAAAIRTDYVAGSRYAGKVHLITATATPGDATTHEERVAAWGCVSAEVNAWQAPGNHFTMLHPPHVYALAKRWISWVNELHFTNEF